MSERLKKSVSGSEKKAIIEESGYLFGGIHIAHGIHELEKDATTEMQLVTYDKFYDYLERIGVYKGRAVV